MVNGYERIYVEREGKIETNGCDVSSTDDHLLRIIDKIVSQIGRRVDESSPMVDARLPDGSRVNAIIPPLSLHGPTLTIRNLAGSVHDRRPDRVRHAHPEGGRFLSACVEGKLNMLISGGTGTGKTTTLNALSAFIPEAERIVTIEDAAELHAPAGALGPPRVTPGTSRARARSGSASWCATRSACAPTASSSARFRGAETLDMLQAMNTVTRAR